MVSTLIHQIERYIDRKDTTGSGKVSRAQRPIVYLDAASGNRKTEPQAGFVLAPLPKRLKQLFRASRRQSAAVVLFLGIR